ncbi:MAG: hypothetical protein KGQ42_04700 [Alphaproteobacteria bacterium]|nr:hypothetical protein [Alphaproteobacteria bacterium]
MSETFVFATGAWIGADQAMGGAGKERPALRAPDKGAMRIGKGLKGSAGKAQLAHGCRDIRGAGGPHVAHHGKLLVFENLVEAHGARSCIKRGHMLSLSREWLGFQSLAMEGA